MENSNDLKIELYPDKKPRYTFETQPISKSNCFSTKLSSLSPDRELANINSNVPILNGFYTAHANHYPIRIKPDDIWLLIIQSFSNHINENAEELRDMFVDFSGKKDISIEYDISFIEQVTKEIAEDFSIKINEELKKYLGEEILDILTPNFTTTTKDSTIVCKISIMSAFKKFFNYRMILCGCGVPYLILEGTSEDYKKIIEKAKKLRKYNFDWYIDRIIPHIQKMVDAKEGNIDVEHFKNMIQKAEKTEPVYRPSAREPDYVEIDYLEGWFLKFFAYYGISQYERRYERFDGKSIKVKDFKKLANQLLKAKFIVKELLTGKEYEMQYKVGFVGCEQNKNNEVSPVIGWCVEPYKEERYRI